jgi:hypothetical protein
MPPLSKLAADSPPKAVKFSVEGSLAPPDLSLLYKPGFFNEDSFAALMASSEESVKLNLKQLDSSPDAFPSAFQALELKPFNDPGKKGQLTEEDEEFTITKFVPK